MGAIEIIIGSITLLLILLFSVFTQLSINCPMCGKGRTITKICEMCSGLGWIPGSGNRGLARTNAAKCPNCASSGRVDLCAFCNGEKRVSFLNWISIKLAKKKMVRF